MQLLSLRLCFTLILHVPTLAPAAQAVVWLEPPLQLVHTAVIADAANHQPLQSPRPACAQWHSADSSPAATMLRPAPATLAASRHLCL